MRGTSEEKLKDSDNCVTHRFSWSETTGYEPGKQDLQSLLYVSWVVAFIPSLPPSFPPPLLPSHSFPEIGSLVA